MTPEENRRRIAQRRAVPSKKSGAGNKGIAWGQEQREEDNLLTPQDMIFAAKIHRPGGSKKGRRVASHNAGEASKPGVRKPMRVNKLG